MKRLIDLLGGTVGGYAGWYLGALVGTMTAFLVSMVTTGVGIYLARRIAAEYLP